MTISKAGGYHTVVDTIYSSQYRLMWGREGNNNIQKAWENTPQNAEICKNMTYHITQHITSTDLEMLPTAY